MRKHFHNVRDVVLPIIDFFYPMFRKLMGLQTFRYAAAGGFNTLLGLAVYYVSYTFILRKHNLDFGFYAFTPHSAALFMSFCISFPVGFFLMKFVVFGNSNISGRVQLVRYLMIYLFTLFINYVMLKLLVEVLHIKVMVAQVSSTIVIIAISYFGQRHFSFKVKHPEADITEDIKDDLTA
jgi:putative flippase GtrA